MMLRSVASPTPASWSTLGPLDYGIKQIGPMNAIVYAAGQETQWRVSMKVLEARSVAHLKVNTEAYTLAISISLIL